MEQERPPNTNKRVRENTAQERRAVDEALICQGNWETESRVQLENNPLIWKITDQVYNTLLKRHSTHKNLWKISKQDVA